MVDDGSTDDTADKLQRYASDPRLRVLHQANQGQSVARNRALERASGDFLCFLDSDDYWPENKLQRQMEIFEANPEVDFVYGDLITIDADGRIVGYENMTRRSGQITRWLLRDNCISISNAIFRRRCYDELGGMDPNYRVAPDYELWLRYSTRFVFLYVPEYWSYYRVMDDQLSSDKQRRFRTNEEILLNFRQEFPEAVSPKVFAEGLAYFYVRKSRYLARIGQRVAALKELSKAFQLTPFKSYIYRTVAVIFLKWKWE